MNKLDLTKTPVTGNRAATHLQKSSDILDDVLRKIKAMGLPDYPKPKREATPLTELDIDALSDRELATIMAEYMAYAAFILPKLAAIESTYRISASNLKMLLSNLKVKLLKTEGIAKSELSDLAKDTPEYMEHELEHLKIMAMREILEAHSKAYSKQYDALSRIVELRKMEFEQTQRQQGVSSFRSRVAGKPGQLRR